MSRKRGFNCHPVPEDLNGEESRANANPCLGGPRSVQTLMVGVGVGVGLKRPKAGSDPRLVKKPVAAPVLSLGS